MILISSNPLPQKGTKVFDGLKHKSGVNTVRGGGTPGEVHPGTVQAMGEEEGDEEGHNADSAPGTPVRPGFLTRLARLVGRHSGQLTASRQDATIKKAEKMYLTAVNLRTERIRFLSVEMTVMSLSHL